MKTITFFANMPSFIVPIANYFDDREDWVVKLFVNGSEEEFRGCLQTSDVLWFEWCNEMLLAALQMMQFKSGKIICRLHSYEAFTQAPSNVDWSKVDDLIFVNKSVQDLMKIFGSDKAITGNVTQHVIPNLIKTEEWDFVPGKDKKNKIASLGHLNYKKDSSMLLPLSESLQGNDMPHKIHIAGEFQDMRYKLLFDQYMKAYKKEVSTPNLVFDGHQKNVNGWLEDKKYLFNSSLFESFGYAIAEGMLCGSLPLVRNWFGVENVWPNITTWNTIGDILGLIEEYEGLSAKEFQNMQEENRQFVVDTYDFKKLIKDIKAIIE